LHIDPNVAAKANFKRPILHGLCFYGYSARAVFDRFGQGNPASVKKIAGRFTSIVFPGETLIIDMWADKGQNSVYYEARTKERGQVVLKAVMEFNVPVDSSLIGKL
jgi:acyl dehydratase